jgi:hypothetical protein
MRDLGDGSIIQEFPTSKEFDKFYFSELLQKPDPNRPPEASPLDGLQAQQIEFLSKVAFAKAIPFKGERLTFECSSDLQIKLVAPSEGVIFGLDAREWLKANKSLEAHLPDELKTQLTKLKHSLDTKKKMPFLWVIKNPENEIWCLKAEALVKKDGFQISLQSWQKQTLKALNRDVQIDLGQNGAPVALDLIVFRYSSIENKNFRQWVTQTAVFLKKIELWPKENRPKFIALMYDEDGKDKAEFNHPFIDDIICLPMDRLITLQKMEIALQLPKKISPSFLFVQESSEDIEVAKGVFIERINELGLAIRNPIPLQVGTPGHFYFKFPGQKELINVYAKVALSLTHPQHEGQYLVFFNYFGIDRNTLALIRNNLARDPAYKILISSDNKKFEYNPHNVFITEEQKTIRTVVVLDPDEVAQKNLAENLKSEFGNVEVIHDDSFFSFYQDHLSANTKVEMTDSNFKDFYAETVSFLIGIEDQKFQMALTLPEEGHELLGHNAQELFSTPDGWVNLFTNNFAREILFETIHILPNLKRSKRIMPLDAKDGTLKRTSIEFVLEENNKIVRINLRAAETMLSTKSTRFKISSIDAIIIDHTLVPEDPTAFLKNITESAKAKGLRLPPGGPKLIVLINDKVRVDFFKMLNHNVFGLIHKPTEIRRLMYILSIAINSPFTMYNFENINWKSAEFHGKLARPAKMTELSEFGVTLKLQTRLKTGTLFYLFGSIFSKAPDSFLCARVFHHQEDESEKGSYLNRLIYFGITDSFLKFTRSYIRETYAAKKSKEGQ